MNNMNINQGTILVVEDNPNVVELLTVTLRFKGYPVVSASNGLEALEKVNQELPALVITDIMMPHMDGFQLAHSLRKDPRTARTPIIFVSATYVTPEDKAFALSLGGVKFIEKPIDTEDFLLTVAETLTQGLVNVPNLMNDVEFYQGYRLRLENKLRYKNTQIARTQRLLETLPEDQKPPFEILMKQVDEERQLLLKELDELQRKMDAK